MHKIIPFLAVLLCVCSCNYNVGSVDTGCPGDLVEKSFCVYQTDSTKAYMNGELGTEWNIGDEFSVYDPILSVGQKFTVVEIKNGKATIKGLISDGNFNFSAVYPYSMVTLWNSENDCSLNIPKSQTIAEGLNMDPKVMVCGIFAADPNGPLQMENLCSLVRFEIARNDVSQVTISLKETTDADANTYTVHPYDTYFDKGTYYALIEPNNYAGGFTVSCRAPFDVNYDKSSSKALTISKGQSINLGIITNGTKRVNYTVTKQEDVGKLGDFASDSGILDGRNDATVAAFNLIINTVFLSTKNDEVTTFNIEYTSADINGNPVTLSARLYLPKKAIEDNKELKGIVLANHHTITRNIYCPTNDPYIAESILVWKNYAVIMPDFHGLGTNSDMPQTFVNGPVIARGNIDAYLAGLQFLKDRKISFKDNLINFGYSQGGLAAVANLRYVAQHPELGITIDKTFSGGGPYDFETCYDYYIDAAKTGSDTWEGASIFVCISLISIIESENLSINYNNVFLEPLASSYDELVLSKNYAMPKISKAVGTSNLNELITPNMFDKNSSEMKAILKKARKYNLTEDWDVPDDSELYLLHSKNDDLIPYENFTLLKEALGKGSNIHYWDGYFGSHEDGIIEFFSMLLSNI